MTLFHETETTIFDTIKKTDSNDQNYWSSRDLAKVLGYTEYRNFQPVIYTAVEACNNSGQLSEGHFVYYTEMVVQRN